MERKSKRERKRKRMADEPNTEMDATETVARTTRSQSGLKRGHSETEPASKRMRRTRSRPATEATAAVGREAMVEATAEKPTATATAGRGGGGGAGGRKRRRPTDSTETVGTEETGNRDRQQRAGKRRKRSVSVTAA